MLQLNEIKRRYLSELALLDLLEMCTIGMNYTPQYCKTWHTRVFMWLLDGFTKHVTKQNPGVCACLKGTSSLEQVRTRLMRRPPSPLRLPQCHMVYVHYRAEPGQRGADERLRAGNEMEGTGTSGTIHYYASTCRTALQGRSVCTDSQTGFAPRVRGAWGTTSAPTV